MQSMWLCWYHIYMLHYTPDCIVNLTILHTNSGKHCGKFYISIQFNHNIIGRKQTIYEQMSKTDKGKTEITLVLQYWTNFG